MPASIKLSITKGAKSGEEFVFNEHDTFLLGRMPDCHMCLPSDTCVSRHHFMLEVNPPEARLRDLGSMNGTYVNGRKVGGREKGESPEEGAKRKYPEVDLRDRDEITVGDTVMCIHVDLPAECAECGAPIPEAAREQRAGDGGTYTCADCRQKRVAAKPPKAPEPVRCQQCGKDVSAEVGQGQRGDFVCEACRQKAAADPMALLKVLLAQARQQAEPALTIPDYVIEKKLGEGGMGAVYLVRHEETGRRVALKVMLSHMAENERSRREFAREIETMRSLRHKNIVEFLDHGSAGRVFYFLLEYCEGGSVDALMARRGGRLVMAEAAPLVLQALEGLAYAHGRGFVHRDLKPQNLLLTGAERHWTAKVADMGLAKSFEMAGRSGNTLTGSYAGSCPFMPREQVTNFRFVKPVSDVWSMGATFYNMITGRYPRDFREGQDPMEVILRGEIVPVRKRDATISKPVADVIDRALANNAKDRYQDAEEMRLAVESAL